MYFGSIHFLQTNLLRCFFRRIATLQGKGEGQQQTSEQPEGSSNKLVAELILKRQEIAEQAREEMSVRKKKRCNINKCSII